MHSPNNWLRAIEKVPSTFSGQVVLSEMNCITKEIRISFLNDRVLTETVCPAEPDAFINLSQPEGSWNGVTSAKIRADFSNFKSLVQHLGVCCKLG